MQDKRILIVKMSSMGDVIHTLPAVSDIKQFNPEIQIDWVVEEAYVDIPKWHPGVTNVIPIALRRWKKNIGANSIKQFTSYLSNLRKNTYDVIIDAQGLVKSALFGASLARGESHGYDQKSVREICACLFYTNLYGIRTNVHATAKIRRLCCIVFGYGFVSDEVNYGIDATKFEADKKNAIMLVVNTARKNKLWADDKWIELAKLITDAGFTIEITCGSKTEKERAEKIAQSTNATIHENLNLEQLAKHIAGVKGMVSLDTGIAHLGAALGIPNVNMCVATDPNLSGALGKNQLSIADAGNKEATEIFSNLQKQIELA